MYEDFFPKTHTYICHFCCVIIVHNGPFLGVKLQSLIRRHRFGSRRSFKIGSNLNNKNAFQ